MVEGTHVSLTNHNAAVRVVASSPRVVWWFGRCHCWASTTDLPSCWCSTEEANVFPLVGSSLNRPVGRLLILELKVLLVATRLRGTDKME